MVLFNYSTKELTAKIVYYGPGLCGKTTNLQFIHDNLPGNVKGKMLSLATKTDRTLFFDFLPIDLGEIRGMKTRVQLYTVPGQVFYNETRKLVLKGADGIVFVADSQEQMVQANVESFKNLEENLKAHGMSLAEMPHVIQFNKRDLPKLAGIEDLNTAVNKYNAPFYESVATTGIGVQDSLKAITKLVLLHLTKKYDPKTSAAQPAAQAAAASSAPPAPPAGHAVKGVPVAAQVGTGSGEGIPLSPAAPPEGFEAPAPPTESSPAQFAASEIEGLIDEVQATESAADLSAEASPEIATSEDEFFDVPPIEIDEAGGEAEAGPARFEVDHCLDPEFDSAPLAAAPAIEDEPQSLERDLRPEAPPVEAEAENAYADPEASAEAVEETTEFEQAAPDETGSIETPGEELPATVTLTEVAGDDDLFNDPGLDVAHLSAGETREILIPVELGDAQSGVRRFKLSVQLRLDPLD